MFKIIFLIILGLSAGIAVGSALASFITLLDTVPRLMQLTNSYKKLGLYQIIIMVATITSVIMDFFNLSVYSNIFFLIPIGFFIGGFIGLIASALAEILNVIPVLENKLRLKELLPIPVLAISLGKVVGSLIDWLILNNVK
ncbi:stage V sporulation protein AB [Senegalia sp. (in: firmicutes)]|uniref:stage V sporulation protein AB n=1 Tax=Senegalia sp. (in: firmicutes) TaxID=1924098 RepID=UPI003F9CB62D